MFMFLISVEVVAAVFGFAIAFGSPPPRINTRGLLLDMNPHVKAYMVARSTTRGARSTRVPDPARLMSSDGGAHAVDDGNG